MMLPSSLQRRRILVGLGAVLAAFAVDSIGARQAFAGSYLDRSILLLDEAKKDRGTLREHMTDKELAHMVEEVADARVNLHSVSGDVRSEFAELRRSSAPASRSVSGSLGAGSGQVSVTTMSGRVMLLRRAGHGSQDVQADDQPDNENEMEGEAS